MVLTVGFIDGYDHYPAGFVAGTPGGITSTYLFSVNAPILAFVTGLTGRGKALQFQQGPAFFGGSISRVIPSTQQLSYAFAMRVDNMPSTALYEFFALLDGLSNKQCQLKFQPTGRISLHGEGDVQMALSSYALTEGTTHRFNFNVDIAAGSAQLWIDGDLTKGFDVSGLDLIDSSVATDIQMVSYILIANNITDVPAYTIDDSVLCVGVSQYLGELEVDTTGIDTTVLHDWTPLTGTDNAAMITDVAGMDGDTTYNHTDTLNAKDLFKFAALPTNPDAIFCQTIMVAARKEESGTRQIQSLLREVGDHLGPIENLSTDYQYFYTHHLVNPETSAAWTAAERLAASYGYNATL